MGKQKTIQIATDILTQGAKKANNIVARHTNAPTKYLQRQLLFAENMGFGWNEALGRYKNFGVTDEIVDTFTPFRRLTKKPCTLSDPQYFIKRYEKEVIDELKYISLKDWESLSEAEKVDFIVKHRYKKLVANKIMNNIAKCSEEHHFLVGENGTIMAYDKGDSSSAILKHASKIKNTAQLDRFDIPENKQFAHIESELAEISIHNHPTESTKDFIADAPKQIQETAQKKGLIDKKIMNPFSDKDLIAYIDDGFNGYVVDSNMNKFYFSPNIQPSFDVIDKNKKIINSVYNKKVNRLSREGDKIVKKLENTAPSDTNTIENLKKRFYDIMFKMLEESCFEDRVLKFLRSTFFREQIGNFTQL